MRFKISAVMILTGAALVALPALAQVEGYRSEASVQALGSFVRDTVDNGVRQNATKSGGVLGSYRFFFTNNHGVDVSYGHVLNTQKYGLVSGPLGVKARSHEMTAAYVFRVPLRRWTSFALAGAGGLVFDPKDAPGAGTQARAAFVYGGGADFDLTKRVFFRAQYRGLVYNSPNFDLSGLDGLARVTHRAEPSIGFGFRF